jgi:hypothetical protein
LGRGESNLRILIRKIAIALGANDDETLHSDIDGLIEFEKQLSDVSVFSLPFVGGT